MYVLEYVLDKRILAILFCVFTLLATVGMGAMIQANSLAEILNNVSHLKYCFLLWQFYLITLYILKENGITWKMREIVFQEQNQKTPFFVLLFP